MPPIAFLALTLVAACERRDVGGAGFHDPGPVVARVNGRPLYRTDLDAYLPTDEAGAITADERKTYFDRWVATQLLYEEAERSGIGESSDIQRKIDQYKKDLVADRLVDEILKARAIVTNREVMAYYRAHQDEYNLEVRVSHILTDSQEDAEEVREMLTSRPFSWVARKMSVDRHTGAGGDLGYLSKGNMLPEFESVVFRMKVGEISDVIESEFGYHILKLTDIRTMAAERPYDVIAPEISRQLLMEKRMAVYDSLITALTERADIDVLDPGLEYAIEQADSMRRARSQPLATLPSRFSRAVDEPGERNRPEPAPDTTGMDEEHSE